MSLALKTISTNMTSHGGFTWPKSGAVGCADWDPEPRCGGGLHALARGEGDGTLLDWSPEAIWLVLDVDDIDVVDLGGKCKFPRCVVVYAGDRATATALVKVKYPSAAVVGAMVTAGEYGTATTGYSGTATTGNYGAATAGDYGTATAGEKGTATAGYRGTATAGDYGTATAGDQGTATAGDGGTATAGDQGTATAGDYGAATAGDGGTATAGEWGTATAGELGIVQIVYSACKRKRIAIAYVGENGIKPNVEYRLNGNHEVVEGFERSPRPCWDMPLLR